MEGWISRIGELGGEGSMISGATMGAYQSWLEMRTTQGLETKFDNLLTLAEAGDTAAQIDLGLMYAQGWHVQQCLPTAIEWWFRAAEQGSARALQNLAAINALQ